MARILELEKQVYQLRGLACRRTANGSISHLCDNPTAAHTPEFGAHVQIHDGNSFELSDINLAIDHVDQDIYDGLAGGLPNDVVFAMPSADQGHGAPEVAALGALDPHTIVGVDGFNTYLPTSAAPHSVTSWSGNATHVVDGAIADEGIAEEDLGNFFDFAGASMPNYPDLQSVPGSSMAAHISPGESTTPNHTAVSRSSGTSAAGPPKRRHQCNTCHRRFARRADRDRHSLTHNTHSPRPYSCSVPGCNRVGANGFWRFDKLNDHLARH
jgi:hypothetical protein